MGGPATGRVVPSVGRVVRGLRTISRIVVHEFTSRFTFRIGRARYGRLAHTTRRRTYSPASGTLAKVAFRERNRNSYQNTQASPPVLSLSRRDRDSVAGVRLYGVVVSDINCRLLIAQRLVPGG